ncbi:MAG: DUF2085 domain-containing protein [Anaerolineae bacterium]|nr:DUF2085 domain-containing protein [Anaerolineae bacterium]
MEQTTLLLSSESRRRWLCLGFLALVLLAFALAPWPLMSKLRAVGFGICAQRPSHSYFLGGMQLPIEARMVGIFGGYLAALVYFLALRRGRASKFAPVPLLVLCVLFIAAMGFDGLNNLFHDLGLPYLYAPYNPARLITGLLTGLTIATLLLPVFNLTVWAEGQARPVLGGWGELAGALAVEAVVFGVVVSGQGWLLYPVALWSMAGAVALLSMLNAVIALIVARREGRGRALDDLLPWICAAVVLTVVELGGLGLFRYALVGTAPLGA